MIVAVVIAYLMISNLLQINPKKFQDLNPIRTHGLCISTAVL